MRVRWAAAAFAVALSATASGQFRSATELVSVDVLVTDGRSPIAGLTAADFELTDNGAPQTVKQIYVEHCRSMSPWFSTAAAVCAASGCAP